MQSMSARRLALCILAATVCLFGLRGYALGQTSNTVQIQFKAALAGQPFECGKNYPQVGKPEQTMTPTDWRMFISDVSLLDARGQWIPFRLTPDGVWQIGQTALLDFENGKGVCLNGTTGINHTIKGQVPAKAYTGIKFKIGVPFDQNHCDPTSANPPLSTTAMFWNWQGGYKFIKFDALTSSGEFAPSSAKRSAFAFHLGSTQCAGTMQTQPPTTACQKPNIVQIELLGNDPRRTPIVFDMATLLSDTDVSHNTSHTPPGCMSTSSDPDCTAIFRHLNLLSQASEAQTPEFVRWSK